MGTLVVFNGTVNFVNNRHHSEGLSGALYLSSFGQMLLADGARLNFTNNIGRFAYLCQHVCIAVLRIPYYM